jgi:hypothetical protein
MSTQSFAFRFKNKIVKLGKDGLIPLNASNPIDKTELPESKLHQPVLGSLPSAPKIMISTKAVEIDNQLTSKSYRSLTPYKLLPQLRNSPIRGKDSQGRDFSTIKMLDRSARLEEDDKSASNSCVKLPRINSGTNNVRKALRSKVRVDLSRLYKNKVI